MLSFIKKDEFMNVSKISPVANSNNVDAVAQRLAAIEGISVLLSIGYAGDGIVHPSPQIVAAALDGIALLAADATRALLGTA
jgi:hypothetical protein